MQGCHLGSWAFRLSLYRTSNSVGSLSVLASRLAISKACKALITIRPHLSIRKTCTHNYLDTSLQVLSSIVLCWTAPMDEREACCHAGATRYVLWSLVNQWVLFLNQNHSYRGLLHGIFTDSHWSTKQASEIFQNPITVEIWPGETRRAKVKSRYKSADRPRDSLNSILILSCAKWPQTSMETLCPIVSLKAWLCQFVSRKASAWVWENENFAGSCESANPGEKVYLLGLEMLIMICPLCLMTNSI